MSQVESIQGGAGTPPEPDWGAIYADDLDVADAREAWGVAIREMRSANILTVANGHAIARLVHFRVQYNRAARHVAEHGSILRPTSKRVKVGQWNPFWAVMRHADDAIKALEAELGIAPVRRGKAAKVTGLKRGASAAEAYLGPRKVG